MFVCVTVTSVPELKSLLGPSWSCTLSEHHRWWLLCSKRKATWTITTYLAAILTSKQCHWITIVWIIVIIFTVSHPFTEKTVDTSKDFSIPRQLNQFVLVTLPQVLKGEIAWFALQLLPISAKSQAILQMPQEDLLPWQSTNAAVQMSWQIRGTGYCHGNCRQSRFTYIY